jgi:hypothetical protein
VRRLSAIAIAVLIITLGTVWAQQELNFLGRYDDVKFIRQDKQDTNQIVFARLIYNGRILAYYKNWYTDYPKGDEQLIQGIQRLTNLNIADHPVAIPITDPTLFKYPFMYSSEVGQMVLNDEDAAIMREYLLRGGFWMVDDFWGSFEMENFAIQMKKILPNAEIKDLPMSHPIFHVFYDIDKIIQVPSLAYTINGGITYEQDGFVGECKGVFDDHGRLVVVINHNTDLGDAYEWADEPRYPNYFSSFAYRVAINSILYAVTH